MSRAAEVFESIRKSQRRGTQCSIAPLLAQMPPDVREVVVANMNEPTEVVWHTTISAALRELGYDVAPHAISRHRNKKCRCVQ